MSHNVDCPGLIGGQMERVLTPEVTAATSIKVSVSEGLQLIQQALTKKSINYPPETDLLMQMHAGLYY